jgi:hypothetical protein
VHVHTDIYTQIHTYIHKETKNCKSTCAYARPLCGMPALVKIPLSLPSDTGSSTSWGAGSCSLHFFCSVSQKSRRRNLSYLCMCYIKMHASSQKSKRRNLSYLRMYYTEMHACILMCVCAPWWGRKWHPHSHVCIHIYIHIHTYIQD